MMTAFGLLILRLGIGLILAAHGAQKLFGAWGGPGMAKWTQSVQRLRIRPATPWAWIAALSEFGGGLLLALGLLSPLGSLAIIGAMLVALALTGPGRYSLDSALGIHLPEPVSLIVGTIALIIGVTATLLSRSPRPDTQTQTV
jgi:putative oxidoreductase